MDQSKLVEDILSQAEAEVHTVRAELLAESVARNCAQELNKTLETELVSLKQEKKLNLKLESDFDNVKAEIQQIALKPMQDIDLLAPQNFQASVVDTLRLTDKNGTEIKLSTPIGVVFNPVDDCLYVCDYINDSIIKVTKSGQASKFVDMPRPMYITFNAKQQYFVVSEFSSYSIKKVTMNGEVSTLAGGGERGYRNGEGKNARFNTPCGVAVNEETDDVYVTDDDKNCLIRMITSGGIVTTLAESPRELCYGGYSSWNGIYYHSQQKVLFVCGMDYLWKVSLTGQISRMWNISQPLSICPISSSTLLVSSSNQIFKVSDIPGTKEVFVGSRKAGYINGPPQESQFDNPRGIAVDQSTNTCFVADYYNHKIRAIQYQLQK